MTPLAVRPMRIALVANTAWYLWNFRLNLLHSLQRAGHEVIAVAPEAPHARRIATAGVEFAPVPINGSGTNPMVELRSALAIRRVLREREIQLVFSYTPKGNLYSALAAISCSVPFVPNVSGLGRAFIRRSAVTVIVQSLYRMTFSRATKIFFQNTDDLATFVRSGLARAHQCERLPGSGVDLHRFAPTKLPDRPLDEPVFLLVARLMWDKGVGEYVEAARRVKAVFPKARFCVLGFVDVANPSAIQRSQVDDWVASGVIEYLGQTEDVRPFLASADCVVLPSYREGVPRTLLEAAAMARPIITTDAPGCRDTVIDGESGWLCRVADPQDLADKLLRFAGCTSAERLSMGAAGRALVERCFDESIVIGRYLRLIQELASASP